MDAHITPIAARVGGTVLRVPVEANQEVEAGAVLVEIDKRDYEVALERARAELADAEAAAIGARVGVPITSTTTSSNEVTAKGGVEGAEAAYLEARAGRRSGSHAARHGAGTAARGRRRMRRRRRKMSSG